MESLSLDHLNKLYAIVDHTFCSEQNITPLAFTKSFFDAGGEIIQYRNKNLAIHNVMKESELLAKEAMSRKKFLIINDYPQVAQKLGVSFHLGQEDFKKNVLSTRDVTTCLSSYNQMWGLSTHNVHEIKLAIERKPTYIGFGSIFQSNTKTSLQPQSKTLDKTLNAIIRNVLQMWKKPLVLIGGISLENIHLLPREPKIFYGVIRDFFRYGNTTKAIERYTKMFLSQLD